MMHTMTAYADLNSLAINLTAVSHTLGVLNRLAVSHTLGVLDRRAVSHTLGVLNCRRLTWWVRYLGSKCLDGPPPQVYLSWTAEVQELVQSCLGLLIADLSFLSVSHFLDSPCLQPQDGGDNFLVDDHLPDSI